jgi:flagellar hook-length control protein FliK
MQQFATTQTSIAANKLPFEDVKLSSSVPRDANNSSFESSAQKSAFEEALAKQEQSSRSSDNNASNSASNNASNSAHNNAGQTSAQSERVKHSEARSSASEARQNSIDKANDEQRTIQRNREMAETDAESKERQQKVITEKNQRSVAATTETNIGEASGIIEGSDQQLVEAGLLNDKALGGKSKNEITDATLKADHIEDDFDWVSYVNQVKDLSASKDLIPNDLYIQDKSTNLDIFAQTIASLTSDNKTLDGANAVAATAIAADKISAGTDPEFLEISLTEAELATLINAAGGNSEESLSLNSEAMAELDTAIAKLLNQLLNKAETEASISEEDAAAAALEDADLLKDLLQASPTIPNDEYVGPISLETVGDDSDIKNENAIELAASQGLLADIIKEESSQSETIEPQQTILKADENLAAKPLGVTENQAATELETELLNTTLSQQVKAVPEKTEKVVEFPLFVPLDKASTKKHTELLAKLPPEAESSAIDNIATRVESVISELKTEGKSTEFIAALQAGVKEMKEQLKQGREPGIDLKSLVTDALAAADVKVSGNADQALEKQINQVSTIFAAATSLNQSNQQQNYLNTGLNEVQGIKEVAQQQIESTRLAQQTTANDKGINIFKPEGQQQLTEKVRWMVNSRNISAEIRLDPPDLGGMNIKVNLSGDSASVSFVVQSQQAREALDQATPRLREMLEEQGIELGQSSVEQESRQGDGQSEQGSLANNSNASSNLAQQSQDGLQNDGQNTGQQTGDDGGDAIEQRISGGRIGGIDYYA